ncbi:MAG: LacI family DNA-binding transcriptional regulator [Chloroflexota bacterium]
MAGAKRVTIAEVAERAGVSLGTASNALNDKGRVHQLLRERVLAVARELGYQPHPFAQALRTGRSRTIGFCVAFVPNPSIPAFLQGASRAAHAAGYNLTIYATENDPELERAHLATLARQRVAGVITFHPGRDPEPYRLVQQAGAALLFVDYRPEGLQADLAIMDHQASVQAAVADLLARGRRRVALLLNIPLSVGNLRRASGHAAAYAAAGLPCPADLVVAGVYTDEDADAAVRALLARPEPPDAVVAGAGGQVHGALAGLRRLGLAVPEQVAFVGSGDGRVFGLTNPDLSLIEIDGRAIGRRLVGLVLERLENGLALPPAREEMLLTSRFVARASSGPAAVSTLAGPMRPGAQLA